MTRSVCYFAYGSNLLFARLYARCPSIRNLGVATLDGHSMSFDKPGGDGSGKCGIAPGAEGEFVIGVLYEMDLSEKPILDRIEGLGHGYEHKAVQVNINDQLVDGFTYYPTNMRCALPPYDWYKGFVLAGARENHFPADYIARIESVVAKPDADHQRSVDNFAIIPDHLV